MIFNKKRIASGLIAGSMVVGMSGTATASAFELKDLLDLLSISFEEDAELSPHGDEDMDPGKDLSSVDDEDQDKDSEAGTDEEIVKEILDETNRYRAEVGAQPLEWDDEIAEGAKVWSQEMADDHKFNHDPSIQNKLGENIYMTGDGDASTASEAWRNSEGHYKNMINKDYTKMGAGIGYDQNGQAYVTQRFSF